MDQDHAYKGSISPNIYLLLPVLEEMLFLTFLRGGNDFAQNSLGAWT